MAVVWASVCWIDVVNNSLCPSSSPLSSNWEQLLLLGCVWCWYRGETRRKVIIWSALGLAVFSCACFLLAGHAAASLIVLGQWVQQLGRALGPCKADLLGQDTFTNVPYTDLIVLCPDRADSLQTSQDVPFPALWLSLHHFLYHIYLFHC